MDVYFRERLWLRVLVLLIFGCAVVFAILPADTRSIISMKGIYYVGAPLAIGVGIGGIVGWLSFNKTAAMITTGIVFATCFTILVVNNPVY